MSVAVICLNDEVRDFLNVLRFPVIPEGVNFLVLNREEKTMQYYDQISFDFLGEHTQDSTVVTYYKDVDIMDLDFIDNPEL